MRNIFLTTEERARKYFEQFPFIQAFLAGVGMILFWRGIWEIADIYQLNPFSSVIIGVLILGGIGLFVQTFVGNSIIIKSVKNEMSLGKKTEQKVAKFEKEIVKEEVTLEHLSSKLDVLVAKIEQIEKH
ncbi:hypothetical protein A3J61_01230 [Candidatus Nomurabacteria bacterium RIFCSPHIGHO2_02_FULL_38_15]|uniref:Uncharacterized protein n=1 Tax=Candidatus Nomurabacteria bacterium RIFCSPHIGHO2_02_FULL_38_15 TaxID=1801752 RepID=A0A1F6VSE3_9BACT|nr:MAG: hypothetical protein A3J61_01230 [Candidatus Nomurabacteria bacterium RIFCSPHIGHO2_02_FULL_38_15]